jgi:hypothetical protein
VEASCNQLQAKEELLQKKLDENLAAISAVKSDM